MGRSYASMTTIIADKLQSTGTADFSVAEMNAQIEDCLKEFAAYDAHIVPVIFKIESRYGYATATSANNLKDTVKDQFLAADATDEKVVHNTTDNTWAVVLTFTDTETLALSSDIFTINEEYQLYNKQCTNKRQIYIGDMPKFIGIDSVEYPLGHKRNWKLLHNGDILEIDADTIEDSNANVTNKPNVDVLVRFIMPHILSQLTDWAGTFSATAAAAATSISATTLQSAGTIEEGEQFTIENHRTLYTVNADATIASNTAAITCYPPLEAAVSSTAWVINFLKSSLNPRHEEIFADLVAARLAINKGPKYFNAISLGGGVVWQNFLSWGERRLAEALGKLRRDTPPKTKRRWPTE